MEHLQHNCDPRFFTTVVFYMGSVSMATQLKFEVFDVYDRKESKVSSQSVWCLNQDVSVSSWNCQ